MGCKRRVLDPGFIYLKSLYSPKMLLTNTRLTRISQDAVEDASGRQYLADVIVLANGFEIGGHLAKLDIRGCKGRSLLEYWGEKGAVSSYKSATISEFPNFFFLDGPNSASGHFSVIYTVEFQVNYVNKLVRSENADFRFRRCCRSRRKLSWSRRQRRIRMFNISPISRMRWFGIKTSGGVLLGLLLC
jgi:cation diffusion facilitator CzcD-associated flavoprotein CzcO